MILDKLLEKYNLKYEDLNREERETINVWVQNIQDGQLTLEKVREYLSMMRSSVENELTNSDCNVKQDLFLKARLRNYLLLESLLDSPERAKEQLDRALASFSKRV